MTGNLARATELFKQCLPQNERIVITLSGDILSDCLKKFAERGKYEIKVTSKADPSRIFYTGTFENGQVFCQRNPSTPQSDTLTGTQSNDLLDGKAGDDNIVGGDGNDKLIGGDGNDKMFGGNGKDLLIAGNGNDELTGGPDSDIFRCGPGNDKITDFSTVQRDLKATDCEQF